MEEKKDNSQVEDKLLRKDSVLNTDRVEVEKQEQDRVKVEEESEVNKNQLQTESVREENLQEKERIHVVNEEEVVVVRRRGRRSEKWCRWKKKIEWSRSFWKR